MINPVDAMLFEKIQQKKIGRCLLMAARHAMMTSMINVAVMS
jgi:hypothetical protein